MVKWIFSYLILWIFMEARSHEYGSKQYHVQVDEGPVRSFRYETYNGQYRKEKRLSDGTVIGTYAWLDANGVLRKKSYIADSAGYRIVKSEHTLLKKPPLPTDDTSFEDNTISRSRNSDITEVTTRRPEYFVPQVSTSLSTPPESQYTNEVVSRNDYIKPTTFRPYTNDILELSARSSDPYLCCELSICNFQNLEASVSKALLKKIYCHNYRGTFNNNYQDAFNYVPPESYRVTVPVVQNIHSSTNGVIDRRASTELPVYYRK